MYSYRIEQAIRAVSLLHAGQERKGAVPLPYATHLYSVAFMLAEYTDNEDVVIAALLHDVLEDTDYTEEELAADFGETVANIVKTVSEPPTTERSKESWMAAKKQYANQIKNGPKEAAMVAAADKIHNFRSIVEEYYSDHLRFLQDFGKHLDDRLDSYQSIANAINKRLEGPLLAEFNHVFETYKEFIYEIKQKDDDRLYL